MLIYTVHYTSKGVAVWSPCNIVYTMLTYKYDTGLITAGMVLVWAVSSHNDEQSSKWQVQTSQLYMVVWTYNNSVVTRVWILKSVNWK